MLLLYVCAGDCSAPQWGRFIFPLVVVIVTIVIAALWNRARNGG
jgi:hypothetical protein